eukprot:SAG31_NODE_249_length_19118_cov_47.456195_15_plen_271_part_00
MHNLTLSIAPGQNTLIVGCNGVGKTSLFRVLRGLWESSSGTISLPVSPKDGRPKLMYLPQTPYAGTGSLASILSYPVLHQEIGSDEVQVLLKLVDLDYLVERFSAQDGSHVEFSLGELQRLSIARLFLHRPLFAVLDECTSALDEPMVERLYKTCEHRRITVLSVSHRPKHKRFHQRQLTLHAHAGEWSLEPVTQCVTPRSSPEISACNGASRSPPENFQLDDCQIRQPSAKRQSEGSQICQTLTMPTMSARAVTESYFSFIPSIDEFVT